MKNRKFIEWEKSMNNEIEIEGMGKIKFEKLIDNNKNLQGIPIKNSKYLKTISYKELNKLIDNNYIFLLLPKRNRIRIFETMPINLISKYRYDVFIKYYYVQALYYQKMLWFSKKKFFKPYKELLIILQNLMAEKIAQKILSETLMI